MKSNIQMSDEIEFIGVANQQNMWARANDSLINREVSSYIHKSKILNISTIQNTKVLTLISFQKGFLCRALKIDGEIKIVSIHRIRDVFKPLIKTVIKTYKYDKIAEFIKDLLA